MGVFIRNYHLTCAIIGTLSLVVAICSWDHCTVWLAIVDIASSALTHPETS